MASNAFGTIFRITTWGESHGKAIGVVIDGCPAGIEITEAEINLALSKRAPGQPFTSPRKEPDTAEIYSGVFEGKTTGTPICIVIPNRDAKPEHYAEIKDLLRPGHANFTYLEKYGVFDYRGGGRASARETACRVAAGTIAAKLLEKEGIAIQAYLKELGGEEPNIAEQIERIKQAGDSLGGVIEFVVYNLPAGLGDPVYEKLESKLAHAMLSLPATKGFEIGSGFAGAAMRGSLHNDIFTREKGEIRTKTNHAGGTLGGITTGMPLVGKVAFKPTSSIQKVQETVTVHGQPAEFKIPEGSRNDPAVVLRAIPIVEAMVALVLADAVLLNRCARL